MKNQNHTDSAAKRRFKYGGFATLTTILFIVAIIIVNMVAGALNDAYPLNLDLTPNSFYTLDEKTEELIEGVEKEITIYVLGNRDSIAQAKYCSEQLVYDLTPTFAYMTNLLETLDGIDKLSDKIKLSYVDLTLNPSFTSNYPNDELQNGSLIIQCGDRYRILTYNELFNSDITTVTGTYTAYIIASIVERSICSAITNVLSEDQQLVTVLTGHDEEDDTAIVNLLKSNNYNVQRLDITTGAIDSESVFLVMNAPKRDYSDEELQKITDYLNNGNQYGKNLMVFFDASQKELPNISEFLQEWGVSVGSDIIYETDSSRTYSQGIFFKGNYDSNDFAESVMEQGAFVALLGVRPVDILWEEKNYVTTKSLLGAPATAVLSPSTADSSWKPSDSEEKGPFSALVMSEKNPYKSEEKTSRVFTWGTSYVATSSLFNNPAYANADYIASIFNTITNNDEVVNVPAKTVADYQISMTSSQANSIGLVLFTILVPLAALGTGVFVYLKRRRL